jgi:cytosine/creatinine deaminase
MIGCIRDVRLTSRGDRVDVLIERGVIAAVVGAGSTLSAGFDGDVVDGDGRVLIPAFVEPHLHLDKALLGPPADGTDLQGAIRATARAKAAFTARDVTARAERLLAAAVAAGTTSVRAQTEVDPGIGLLGVEAVLGLAEGLQDVVRVGVAVFPQEGLLARPGTAELMREALAMDPTMVVGGCPYAEGSVEDARLHVDAVLDIAVAEGRLADLHLDLAADETDPRYALAAYVAEGVQRRGLEGRVTIGHATSLVALPSDRRARILAALAEARVGVVLLPATDLFLTGHASLQGSGVVPPLRALWNAGVPVALSSNNVRNAFTPTGTADPLDAALLLGRVAGCSSRRDFARLLDMATVGGAALLDPAGVHGVRPGAAADLVLLDSTDPSTIVLDQPDRALVLKAGVPVASTHRDARLLGPAAKRLGATVAPLG